MKIESQDLLDMNFIGALDFDQRPHGISPRRLPDWTRSQLPQNLDVMARMPSGVRLAFTTDSKRIALNVQITKLEPEGNAAGRTPVFNLEDERGEIQQQPAPVCNTIYYDPSDPAAFRMDRGGPCTIEFQDCRGSNYEIWLPHNAYVELQSMELDDGASLGPAQSKQRRWVHYGSSISHCMEAEQPALIWPAVAARLGGACLHNLGFGGQCHLDQFVARSIRDLNPDVISIKVGINLVNGDSMRERVFTPALHGFLDTIRETLPVTPILLVSPIFCPSAEDHPGPTLPDANGKFVTVAGSEEIRQGCLTLSRIRILIEELVALRNDSQLGYLNGLALFSESDAGDLPDDLHPNPAGYIRMGERFAEQVFLNGGFFDTNSSQSPSLDSE